MSCSCQSCSSHEHKENNNKRFYTEIFLMLLFIGLGIKTGELIFFIISYVIIGYDILKSVFKNLIKGNIFDENFLMFIASIGAFYIGERIEAIAIILFYRVGEFFEQKATIKSRQNISDLVNMKAETAMVIKAGKAVETDVKDIQVGDEIIVKAGEIIPVDALVLKGNSLVDTSKITGESLPKKIEESDEVSSGFMVIDGVLNLKTINIYEKSTIYKILDLIENAGKMKSKTEKFITKFAGIYTKIIVLIAVLMLIIPVFFMGLDKDEWILKAIIFLAVSCPCAMVLSIPMAFFGAIGKASKEGILIKGSNFLEAVLKIKNAFFDKTGTVTDGNFKITKIVEKNIKQEDFLTKISFIESFSNHPLAKIISKDNNNFEEVEDFKEISGKGIKAKYKGDVYVIGNDKLLKEEGIDFTENLNSATKVNMAINGENKGFLLLSDEIKPDAENVIKAIKRYGIKTTILSGDNEEIVRNTAKALGVDNFYAKLLPDEKVNVIKETKEASMFVGDGINDAPSVMVADVGISFASNASDATKQASDIVITGNLSKIVDLFKIAKATRHIVLQNIVFVLAIKLLVLGGGAFGIINIWHAIFADVGVSIIAVLNSLKIFKIKL